MTAPFSPARARPAWLPGWLPGWLLVLLQWPLALVRAARPRQWPKNLLVFAAPLAADSLRVGDNVQIMRFLHASQRR